MYSTEYTNYLQKKIYCNNVQKKIQQYSTAEYITMVSKRRRRKIYLGKSINFNYVYTLYSIQYNNKKKYNCKVYTEQFTVKTCLL